MIDLGTPAEVAKVLHTTEASLAQMRYRGDGPVFVRAGRRRVLYRWADVDQWIKDSRRTRTDEVRVADNDRLGSQDVGGHPSSASVRPGRRNRDEGH